MCTFLLYCYVCCFMVQYVILLSCRFVLLVLCLFFVLYVCFLFFLFLVIVLYVCFIVSSSSSYLVFVFFVPVYWTLPPGRNPIAVNNNNNNNNKIIITGIAPMGWHCLWLRPPTGLFFIPQEMYEYGAKVGWYWQGKTAVFWGKPIAVIRCPPQIPHGLTRSEPGPPRWKAGEWPPGPGQGLCWNIKSRDYKRYSNHYTRYVKTCLGRDKNAISILAQCKRCEGGILLMHIVCGDVVASFSHVCVTVMNIKHLQIPKALCGNSVQQ
jgi:hypothetical protein